MKTIIAAAMMSLALAACGGGYDKSQEYDKPAMTETPQYQALLQKLQDAQHKAETCECDDPFKVPGLMTEDDIRVFIEWARLHDNREQMAYYNNILAEHIIKKQQQL